MIKIAVFMKKVVFILFIAFAFAVSCAPNRSRNAVKIGVIIPESSGLGASIKSGLKLAEEELNKNSKIKYQLVFADAPTVSDVDKRYERLRHVDKIRIFVTTGTKYSMKIKSSSVKNRDLLFCVASDPAITAEGNWGVYKIGNSSVDESEHIVNYLNSTKSEVKVALFYPNTEYGIPFYETISDQLKKCTAAVYEESAFQQYDDMIAKVLKSSPDKVIAIGFSPSLGILIKKLRTLGFQGEILSNAGFADSDVIAAAGDAVKGVKYVDYNFEMTSRTMERNEFIRKNYGIDFASISFLAYSIPYLIDMGFQNYLQSENVTVEKLYNSIDESVLNNTSNIIRSADSTSVAEEYLYNVYGNGDVKPSLILRQHD